MPLAKWVNEVKLNTLDYIEAAAGLGYSRAVQRRRPGIAKADALPDNLVEDPALGSLVRATLADLDALISAPATQAVTAFTWGTPERGGARLVRASRGSEAESLQIRWNANEIESIRLESRHESRFEGPAAPAEVSALLARLVPMVWRFIRRGGELPPGIARFADCF